jgi:hypothetical protein
MFVRAYFLQNGKNQGVRKFIQASKLNSKMFDLDTTNFNFKPIHFKDLCTCILSSKQARFEDIFSRKPDSKPQ